MALTHGLRHEWPHHVLAVLITFANDNTGQVATTCFKKSLKPTLHSALMRLCSKFEFKKGGLKF